jgi:hypothetical protein
MGSELTQEQAVALQQRVAQLEQMLQQAQSSTEPSSSSPTSIPAPMDTNEFPENLPALHSLEIRPAYGWTPPQFLTEFYALDEPLFTSSPLSDEERKRNIEKYPPIQYLQYQPPDTMPIAAKRMSKSHSKQDLSLKRLQYLVSGIFRPMDVLGLEISKDENAENAERYSCMLADCRLLLRNLASQITELRKNIAFQAVNPNFTASSNSSNLIMDPSEFQTSLGQQVTNAQTLQNATKKPRFRKGNFSTSRNSNQAAQPQPPQQFFRSGPSSEQGGYDANYNKDNNPFWNKNGHNNNGNKQRNNKNPFVKANRS